MLASFEAAERLRLHWYDGVVSEHPWVWLRDHSHDPSTLHPVTGQRLVASPSIDPSLRPRTVTVASDDLVVDWGDGRPASVLPLAFLHRHRSGGRPRMGFAGWSAGEIVGARPTVAAAAVLGGEAGVRVLLDHIDRYGVCLIEQADPSIDTARALLERLGYVRRTIFGSVWEFGADLARADTAYTDLELAPHTDGTYSNDAPGLQLLLCVERDGTGGETVLVDGFRVAGELRSRDREMYDVLATVLVPGRYVGDGVHLLAERPVLRHDGAGRLVQVSLNHADRAPLTLPPDETERFYAALRAFDALIADSRFQWRFTLEVGTAMLFDNWRVLHGRTAYTGRRRLCGGYLNREDYESRRRVSAGDGTTDGPGRPPLP